MGIFRSLGTSWHDEYLSREDGDPRRHPSRCIFYRKSDKHCIQYIEKCHGSAHCPYYEEEQPHVDNKTKGIETDKSIVEKSGTDNRKVYHNPFSVGETVVHKLYGKGEIMDMTDGKVRISFENGEEKLLGLEYCCKHNLLKKRS